MGITDGSFSSEHVKKRMRFGEFSSSRVKTNLRILKEMSLSPAKCLKLMKVDLWKYIAFYTDNLAA